MTAAATVPAESCYWVRLPPATRRWTRDRILAGIEPWIPSDIDRLDLAWQAGSDGQMLVVAVESRMLDTALATMPEAWSAAPDRIPDHVAVAGVEAADLNLLTGTRSPRQLRRLERNLILAVLAITTLTLVLLGVGTWSRGTRLDAGRLALAVAGEKQLIAALPVALCGNDPDPLLRLDQAERLTRALVRAAEGSAGGSATLFGALLIAWPTDLRAQVASLSLDGNRCTISGTATTVEETQRLSAALAGVIAAHPGWHLLPLQAISGAGSVTFTCTMVREGT